jgi:hypothetical protein
LNKLHPLLEEKKMHQDTLKTIFLAMVYAARSEGEQLEQKYYDLEDEINEMNDLSLSDMVHNIENVFKLIERE